MKRRSLWALATGPLLYSQTALSFGNPVAGARETGAPLAQSIGNVVDPSCIEPRFDSRSVSFENPTGARGGGGRTGNGHKGSAFRILEPGEKVVLADLIGPGTLRHFWATFDEVSPEVARALRLEVFYDGLNEPSISVPFLDFFGLPHGRMAEYYSALASINDGRGLNSHIPLPFRQSIRVEFTNESKRHIWLFYQIDYTLEPPCGEPSYLHVAFRRENPTTLGRDFVIAQGLEGPGRFLGCAVGIRILDGPNWYGEGEVKIYRDGDQEFPTYCGTGLEDYVGSAWGMKRHYGPFSGVPINLVAPAPKTNISAGPLLVGFYRWHLPDPVMFASTLKVTIQQIGGADEFSKAQGRAFAKYRARHRAVGPGWLLDTPPGPNSNAMGFGLIERSDDYCAAAFVYCRRPQPVPRFKTVSAIRDVAWRPGEHSKFLGADEEEWERFSIAVKNKWVVTPAK